MKKLVLSLSLIFLTTPFLNAQENSTATKTETQQKVIGLELASNVGGNFGAFFEIEKAKKKDEWLFPKFRKSAIIKLSYNSATIETVNALVATNDITGSGWSAELGSRLYFNQKDIKGFYLGNSILGGSIEFDEDNFLADSEAGEESFYGKYRYLSFFAPEIGFKFLIANTVAVNFHVGTTWLIEFKSKGDVSNSMFDNWQVRAGVAIGYNF
ncbi:MAG: hypothetical protein ACQESK_10905 [Bacteroidota bacterium]